MRRRTVRVPREAFVTLLDNTRRLVAGVELFVTELPEDMTFDIKFSGLAVRDACDELEALL